MKHQDVTGLALVGSLALYMLSIGPAYRYTRNFQDAGPLVRCYYPLIWLATKSVTLGATYNWYVRLWEVEEGVGG